MGEHNSMVCSNSITLNGGLGGRPPDPLAKTNEISLSKGTFSKNGVS